MVEEFTQPILALSVAIVVTALVSLLFKKLVQKVFPPKQVQVSIMSFVHGPISIAIIGYGLVWSAEYIDSAFLGMFPGFLKPVNIAVLVEVVILASAVRAAILSVRVMTPLLAEGRPVSRMLTYSIYVAGLVALAYILLGSNLSPRLEQAAWAGINFVAGLFATYLAVYILGIIIERYVHIYAETEPRLKTTFNFIRRLVLTGAAIVGVSAVTFATFPAAAGLIASVFVAAGFASIVIGLAAQSSVSNIIAGMVVSVSQPFKIGEAVMFKNEFCFVEDIKLVHTVLRTWDNRRLMIPNSLLLSEIVVNYTAEDSTMLTPVFVQVSYESDLDKAMEIMRRVAISHPDCMPIGDLPNVVVMDYAESGMNLRLLSRAKDQPTAFKMARNLLYHIKKEFDANGIEIPYPRRQIVLGRDAKRVLEDAFSGSPRTSEEARRSQTGS